LEPKDRWIIHLHRKTREQLHERLKQRKVWISDEKQELIIRLTFELTQFYDVLEQWAEWAYRMAIRESFGTTWVTRHVAAPHNFQSGRVNTFNSHIDWWAVLLPQGIDCWDAWDNEPIHVMFTQVFTRPSTEDPTNYVQPMCLLSQGLQQFPTEPADFMIRVSRMDRLSAARLINRHIVRGIKEETFRRKA
jgi:mannitol/fructose-specific phosphotransferase system IIA component